MVIVSHDREFLDQLCTKIVETERGVAATYKGGCWWAGVGHGGVPGFSTHRVAVFTADAAAKACTAACAGPTSANLVTMCRQLHAVCQAEGGAHCPAMGGLGEAAEGDCSAGIWLLGCLLQSDAQHGTAQPLRCTIPNTLHRCSAVQEEMMRRLAAGANSGRASTAEKALERLKAEGTYVEKPFVPKKR